jgi:hypothetical protein
MDRHKKLQLSVEIITELTEGHQLAYACMLGMKKKLSVFLSDACMIKSRSKLFLFGIRKNCLISGRSLLLYQFTRRVMKPTVVIIGGYHCNQLHTKFIQYFFPQG